MAPKQDDILSRLVVLECKVFLMIMGLHLMKCLKVIMSLMFQFNYVQIPHVCKEQNSMMAAHDPDSSFRCSHHEPCFISDISTSALTTLIEHWG
jgi:hypothetical protein